MKAKAIKLVEEIKRENLCDLGLVQTSLEYQKINNRRAKRLTLLKWGECEGTTTLIQYWCENVKLYSHCEKQFGSFLKS